MATRCRVPPLSVDGLAPATSRSPTRPSSSADRAAWRSRGQPASSIGNRTFSSTLRHARRRGSWNTRPTDESGPATGRPSIATEPVSGAMSPARTRSSVLLPQPLGPMSATTSRGATSSERCSSAVVVRAPRNVSETSSTRMPAPGPGTGRVRDGRVDGGGHGHVEPRIGSGRCGHGTSVVRRAQRGRTANRAVSGVRTRRRRCLLPSGLYRRLRSARLAPRLRICSVVDDVRGAARGLVPRRGTLPPVGNCTLPRRLCPECTTARVGIRSSPTPRASAPPARASPARAPGRATGTPRTGRRTRRAPRDRARSAGRRRSSPRPRPRGPGAGQCPPPRGSPPRARRCSRSSGSRPARRARPP